MKSMKPLSLHRLSIALLTMALLICASSLAYEQREALRVQKHRDYVLSYAAEYRQKYEASQTQLARQRQINAHMERWLSAAARRESAQSERYFHVTNQGDGNLAHIQHERN